jgi:hypothetical protein
MLLKAVSSSKSAICLYCQTLCRKRHSVYARKSQALSCSNATPKSILDEFVAIGVLIYGSDPVQSVIFLPPAELGILFALAAGIAIFHRYRLCATSTIF